MSIPTPIIIDISEHQTPNSINYDNLAKAIDGVIIRIQYGSNYIDNHYKTHISEFQKRGIPVAVYAWVRGVSNRDMEQEATDFYNRAKAYNPTFWWLDVEEQSMGNMRSGCEAFRAKLKKLGATKVGAYVANHLYSQFNLDTGKFDGLWVPTYGANNGQYNGSNPTATSNYNIHQYTSEGRLSGYNGPLDMNRIASGSFNTFFGGGSKVEQYHNQKGWYEMLVNDTFYTNPSFNNNNKSGWLLAKGSHFYVDEVVDNPSKTAKRGKVKHLGDSGARYMSLNKDIVKKL